MFKDEKLLQVLDQRMKDQTTWEKFRYKDICWLPTILVRYDIKLPEYIFVKST